MLNCILIKFNFCCCKYRLMRNIQMILLFVEWSNCSFCIW